MAERKHQSAASKNIGTLGEAARRLAARVGRAATVQDASNWQRDANRLLRNLQELVPAWHIDAQNRAISRRVECPRDKLEDAIFPLRYTVEPGVSVDTAELDSSDETSEVTISGDRPGAVLAGANAAERQLKQSGIIKLAVIPETPTRRARMSSPRRP